MGYEGNGPVIVLLMYGYDFILWHILVETNIVYIHHHPLVPHSQPAQYLTHVYMSFWNGVYEAQRKGPDGGKRSLCSRYGRVI